MKTFLIFYLIFLIISSRSAAEVTQATAPTEIANGEVTNSEKKVSNDQTDTKKKDSSESDSDDTNFLDIKKEYQYNENEGRDPFKMYKPESLNIENKIIEIDGSQEKEEITEKDEIILLSVPEDISLTGVMYSSKLPVAAIRNKTKGGKLFFIRPNQIIGKQGAKVIEIKPNGVMFEVVKDFDGQKVSEKFFLKVNKRK